VAASAAVRVKAAPSIAAATPSEAAGMVGSS